MLPPTLHKNFQSSFKNGLKKVFQARQLLGSFQYTAGVARSYFIPEVRTVQINLTLRWIPFFQYGTVTIALGLRAMLFRQELTGFRMHVRPWNPPRASQPMDVKLRMFLTITI